MSATERIYNFSPGPAVLPQSVLEQAARDIVNFNSKGMGLIEMSHRSKDFIAVLDEADALIRELLAVPSGYKVLFLQGGASSQFFMAPMNLLGPGKKAAYLNTGVWAGKAIKEAKAFGQIDVAYTGEPNRFKHVPTEDEYSVAADTEYLHLCSNNTIYGTRFPKFPDKGCPLVCDMSSDIMSRPVDVAKFGLIYAGAQKNMGPAGVTVVIIREDWLERCPAGVPAMLRYKTHADKGSMYNTPPTFSIYCVGLVMRWLKEQGGLAAMERRNEEKAALVYQAIDATDFYRGHSEKDCRSLMNISFNLPTTELEAKFVKGAAAAGLDGLKGHRDVGGCRASIYNAFPLEGVHRLVEFMADFAKQNG